MRVFQIPFHVDPLFERLHVAISNKTVRPSPRMKGDIAADLGAGIPSENRDMPNASFHADLPLSDAGITTPTKLEMRGRIYYPAGGGFGWHTNAHKPGWRLYVPHALVRCPIAGTLTEDGCYMDRPGFANLFEISADWRLSWHATFAVTERWSVGVWLPTDSPRVQAWLDWQGKNKRI